MAIKLNTDLIKGTCMGMVFPLLMSGNVLAQNSTDAAATDEIEEVVVTGSNILRKRDYDTPSPIQTLGLEEVGAAGAGQVQDLLRVLSVNTGSELSNSQSQRQGVSQFNLRGLGVAGTLTLINGRRAGISPVAQDDGSLFTDINQYPVNMIGKVEVLTDGSSATYGSEAVSGVVNIITRKIEGFEFGAEVRSAINDAYQINAAFGHSFDRGHFQVFVNSYKQDGNFRGEFDFIQQRTNNGGNGLSVDSSWDSSTGVGRYQLATETAPGSNSYTRGGNTVPDAHCAESGPGNFVAGTNCRYNFINQRRLIPEESRLQAFAQFHYNLTDKVEFFSELSFSANEIRDAIGGAVLRTTTQNGGFLVPATHPFNYFVTNAAGELEWNQAAVASDPNSAVAVISRHRPLTSFYDGARADDITREFDNSRVLVGVSIDLSNNWNLRTSYMTARSKFTDLQPRSYNADAYAAAILSGAWNPFGISTADPTAISVKDSTTAAGNTPDDILTFSSTRSFVVESIQEVAEIIISGEAYTYADGRSIGVAFGAQTRKIKYNDTPDSLSYFKFDGRADQVIEIRDASQSVKAVFGEVLVPLHQNLDLQVALRYEDYGQSSGGSTLDPKIGIHWQATEPLLFRASYGTSFQAPSIRNIFGSVGSGTLDDPISGNFSAGDACDVTTADSFNAAQITTGGTLKPQSAENINLGVVFQPSNAISLSIDYWTYDYTDLIQTGQAFQSILTGECRNSVYAPDSRVVRDAAGQLNSVTTSFINVGVVEASGIDVNLDLRFGAIGVFVRGTYVDTFDIKLDNIGPTLTGASNRNASNGFGSIPDTRINLGANWSHGRHFAEISGRFIGEYNDIRSDGVHPKIDSQFTIDTQYSVKLGDAFDTDKGATLTVGATNLGNEDPPRVDERISYDYQVHDPRGRIVYLRFKYAF